ncbi:MAG: DUF4013 domain-containing protein [Nanoarchaeota archaeon]
MEQLTTIFWKSIKRPFSNWRILLLSILFFARIPFLYIITGFLAMGYILKVGEFTQKGKWELPSWNNFLELFKRGFYGWLIVSIYFLPTILISLILYFWFGGFPKFGDIFGLINYFSGLLAILGNVGYLLVFLLLISYIVGLYLIPCALLEYVREYNFSSAFNLRSKNLFSKRYTISWILLEIIPLTIITAISFLREQYYTIVVSASPIKYLFFILIYLIIAFKEYFVNVLSYSVYASVLNKKRR